jgi:hypothetical protein
MFDSWLSLSGSGLDLRSVDRAMTPSLPAAPGGVWGQPSKFATYRDPRGRFEFDYPLGWTLEVGDAVLVRSVRLASFARVDTIPLVDAPWPAFRELLARSGGQLSIEKEMVDPVRRLRGLLDWNGGRFALQARAYPLGTEILVFSTAAGAASGAAFRRYEAQVRAALRRGFRLSPL